MDDLDRMLAGSLHDAAGRAPSPEGLLNAVRRRSDRYRRRRVAAQLSALAAVAALGIPAGIVLANRPAALPATATREVVRLTAGFQPPAFPYTLPPTGGMKAPTVTLRDGDLVALFEATDQRDHADTTVTVTSGKPAFATAAAETPVQVRGRNGLLRTVDVRPAAQLTLYWQESGRWIQLATDDTYTPQEVVALADALSAASIAVPPPFRLDYSPAGMVADTISPSTMSFRPAGASPGSAAFSVVLRKPRPLTGVDRTIAGHDARLTRDAGVVRLAVDVTDWEATLEITVGAGLTISDDDLVRFAAGVHILNRSDPE
ncbi:hypothetical protein [Paractinoplanes hotanensis]|uniref:DUF4367 domain-containing protein n=1 Tax=Paractinoplanes hotanensis TaxID=2906497 RepID=A0ABT0XW29_9ACTN|nr:hypothetical protein [Actinoplanes hotanensis]MCM4077995.1 hypothetical protein [Actinoplanes hotanensis]